MTKIKTIKEYLEYKNISFTESNGELVVKCIFSNCDIDSTGNTGHLYFDADTGMYQCKKCDAKGNLITLQKHFGDLAATVETKEEPKKNIRTVTPTMVDKCHEMLPDEIIKYLNLRGISNEIIESHKIGYMLQYGTCWIAIPIKDINGNYSFFKLRQDPNCGNKKMTWPSSSSDSEVEAQIYDWESLIMATGKVLIAEGEIGCSTNEV